MQHPQLTWWQRYSIWLEQALIRSELGPWLPAEQAKTPTVRGRHEH